MKTTKFSTNKKIMTAASMLLLSTFMLSSATYAWFTMNTTVSITGMKMQTRVDSNLLIDDVAPCHATNGTWVAGSYATNDSNFRSSTEQTITSAILAPISTVDAYSYFATAPDNVTGSGDAIVNEYTAVDDAQDLIDLGYASVTDAYLDYHFVLKAVNTDSSNPKNINLSQLKMTFSKASDTEKAFRVAVLSKKFATATVNGAKTLPDIDASGAAVTKIYAPASAANFESGKAVASTSATGSVTYASAAADGTIATVAAGATEYYEVIVRCWLEGEDQTCNVNTFQSLVDGTWNLDTKFTLEEGTTSAVYQIEQATTTPAQGG